MIHPKYRGKPRRGTTIVECAVVYPVTMFLLLGTLVVGVGVFNYQQLQSLAREGARYASVHGPQYASEKGESVASTSDVQTQVQQLAVGLSGLKCTGVSYKPSASSLPCTVKVTLTYTWTPGAFFGSMSWTATSTMPVTY